MARPRDYRRDFARDYGTPMGYNRSTWQRGDFPEWRTSDYGYDRGWRARRAGGGQYGPGSRYETDYLGRPYRYAYGDDYQYRREPEESPLYGRGADREIRRWANRYGYDLQYEIQPRRAGGGFDARHERSAFGRSGRLPRREYRW